MSAALTGGPSTRPMALAMLLLANDSTYSQGKNLTNTWDVWMVVQNALDKDLLPQNPDGIYVVVSSRFGYLPT